MQIAFAEHDGAGVEQSLHDDGVAFGAVAGQPRRAAGGRIVGGIEVVLQRKRHAVQRAGRRACCPLPIGFPGRRADFVRLERDEGVEACVRRRARQQRIGQRFGRRLAGADRFRRLRYSKIIEFRHRRTLYGFRRVAAAFQCRHS